MLSLMNGVASTTAITKLNIIPPVEFLIPAGFDKWVPSFKIFEHPNGRFSTDFDISSVKPSGLVAYVAKDGDDTSGDGSEASPYRTLGKAYDVGAVQILVKSGHYTRSDGFDGSSFRIQQNTAIIATEGAGSVILSRAFDGLTWVQQAAPNDSVYFATKGGSDPAVMFVIDEDAPARSGEFLMDGVNEVPIPATKQTSVANCQANAGSYYVTGDDIYMHTHDGRAPDGDVHVLASEGVMRLIDGTDIDLYFEGIEFWGRGTIRVDLDDANTSIFAAKDCASRFSDWVIGSASIKGASHAYFQNVHVSDHTGADGFGYGSSSAAVRVNGLEVDCSAKRIGIVNNPSNNNNGTTAHNNAAIIRLNGDYQQSWGPVVADVLGAHSLNLNCLSGNSLIANNIKSKCAFQTGTASNFDSTNSKMWLKNCESVGREYDRVAASGGEMFDLGGFVGENNKDSGTITSV